MHVRTCTIVFRFSKFVQLPCHFSFTIPSQISPGLSKTAVPSLLGLIPHLTLINYLFSPTPPPPSPTRIPHASHRHKITVFNIPLCVASDALAHIRPILNILRLRDSGKCDACCVTVTIRWSECPSLASPPFLPETCLFHQRGIPPGWEPLV